MYTYIHLYIPARSLLQVSITYKVKVKIIIIISLFSGANSMSKAPSKAKLKLRTLNIVPLRESSPQKRSGMARVLKGFHSFTCTPTRSSAIGMSHTCLCLPSRRWYSFTDPGGMEG